MNIDIAGKLFPDLITMITQLLSTGILLYFVKRWLWGPAREYLNKRAEYAQAQIADAEALKVEAQSLHSDAAAQLKSAGAQARDLLDKAKQDGLSLKDSIVKDAKQEAEGKLEAARREISFEKQAMRDDVAKEIVDVAMAAAEKLLVGKATEDEDRKAIERFVKEVAR